MATDGFVEQVLADIGPLEPLDLTLLDAHGCVLAEDVRAGEALPPFDRVTYDGYAVRLADLAPLEAGRPVQLPVVGDVTPGAASGFSVQPGMAVRVQAGVALPTHGEAVVPTALTDGGVAAVQIRSAVGPGAGIQRSGADVAAGDVALSAGTYLRGAQIALLAAAGCSRAVVRPKPRVVVLSVGPELVEPGHQRGNEQVYDANSVSLTAAAMEAGAVAYRVGIVPDDPRQLLDALEDQLVRADCILTTVGRSERSQKVLTEVVRRLGEVRSDRIGIEPGGLVSYGRIGFDRTPYFGLPGDPVGAMVAFEVLVRPVLRRMLGSVQVHRPVVRARITQAARSRPDALTYLPAWLDVRDNAYVVTPTGAADTIAAYGRANALVVLDAGAGEVAEGAPVTVMLLERRAP